MAAAGSLVENMPLAKEIKTLMEKSKGNRQSDVSKTIVFVDPTFQKGGKTSKELLEIVFSLMVFALF